MDSASSVVQFWDVSLVVLRRIGAEMLASDIVDQSERGELFEKRQVITVPFPVARTTPPPRPN